MKVKSAVPNVRPKYESLQTWKMVKMSIFAAEYLFMDEYRHAKERRSSADNADIQAGVTLNIPTKTEKKNDSNHVLPRVPADHPFHSGNSHNPPP